MLQVAFIRENKERVLKGLAVRNFKDAEGQINQVLELDDKRKQLQQKNDQVLSEANAMAKSIGLLMREGKQEEANQKKQETAALKSESKVLTEELKKTETDLQQLLYNIPNIPNDKVPAGNTETDNIVAHQEGDIPELHHAAKRHWELIEDYDIIDFELGVKITGAGFPVYKNKGAKLQRALINFFLDEAEKAGFIEVQPPIVINEDSGYGTGQLPDKEGQTYHVGLDNFFLLPTAEVPITNIYRDVILTDNQLPIKNVGYTPCFRREAGSWGSHVRGLNRLHQFDKVEIVRIEHPDKSYEALEEMSKYIQSLLKKLELPYRVLILCGGDLGFTSALTYDMEV